MLWRNSNERFGLVSVVLHWVTALAVIGLFALGLWMEDLDYTHPWYKIAPHLHKSIGVLLIVLVLLRLLWRWYTPPPAPLAGHKPWEKISAKVVHFGLYFLLILMLPSGYLMTTAQGQSLDVFNWFTIPPTITGIDNLEDLAGEVHELMAFTIIGMVILHALGAVKHHWFDRDETLKRIVGL